RQRFHSTSVMSISPACPRGRAEGRSAVNREGFCESHDAAGRWARQAQHVMLLCHRNIALARTPGEKIKGFYLPGGWPTRFFPGVTKDSRLRTKYKQERNCNANHRNLAGYLHPRLGRRSPPRLAFQPGGLSST